MQPLKKAAQKPTENPACPKCNRKREGKCFEYGSTDHMLKNCSQWKHPTQGRVFVKHDEDADLDTTPFTNGFVSYLGVKYNKLDVIYYLTVPFGEELPTSSMVTYLSLDLQGHTDFAELIVLQMTEFDIIMGMNWLSKNGVTIDLLQKSVRVRPLSEEKFVFEPNGRNNTPQMISCLQARKLMHKGCQAFFASIISAPVTTSQTVAEVPVVNYFPNVFPNDVVVIPPEQEVEFSIDHMSGTVPISKEQYRSERRDEGAQIENTGATRRRTHTP
ncbi:uncharacterized protein [Primulina eburnea]|uniref:uncharacterized protein n=1 Tax=Primulina eburnea TaxID=1245227 RepID=UPI003C6C4BCA